MVLMGARGVLSRGVLVLCAVGSSCALWGAASALAAVAPTVEETFVTNVSSTSATLQAKLNPGGADTTYRFEDAVGGGEYAPVRGPGGESLTGAEGDAGEGTLPVSLEVHVPGLAPSTSYRFRLVASSSAEKTVDGPEVTFTTQGSGEFALPDGRQWEMVTPPQKQGALFMPRFIIQASAGGSAIADVASAPTEVEPQGNAIPMISVLSTRGPSGWSSQVIAPPHPEAGPVPSRGTEYQFFSQDLSRGVLQPLGNFVPLSPAATEPTAYLRTDYLNGDVSEHCEASYKSASSCFQPLVTAANTRAGAVFGEPNSNGECFEIRCGPEFQVGTPDLSHVVVSSPAQLTSTPVATEAGEKQANLYEWSGGRLQLLSIPPGSEVGAENFRLAGRGEGSPSGTAARHAISDDGGRVVIETVGKGGGGGPDLRIGLYLRDVAKGETVRLDVPQGEGTEASVVPEYMTASSDASRIFFLDRGRLTPNSGASYGGSQQGNADVYECKISEEAGTGKDRCSLTDLTPKTGGESASVAMVLGASVDGSYVYFAAAGNIAQGAQPGGCPRYTSGEPVLAAGTTCNLYVSHAGVTTFVAGLSQEDFREWTNINSSIARMRARVAPDGRWFAFMSNRDLTSYDTRDAVTGLRDEEVYLYDASANRLVCASCDPTGARPVGFEGELGTGFASLVPGWTTSGFLTRYQSRYLSDSGRLFFDSEDALVPRDVNGTQDVYQYEPEGVPAGEHACTRHAQSGSVVFKPARGFEVEGRKGEEGAGCVGLISSGTSPEESTFLDASETGGDVFFLSTSKLAPQDFDNAYDVYDAHECAPDSPCLPTPAVQAPPCDTEASCRAAPTPQPAIFGTPASGTFTGPGNVISLQSSRPKSRTAAPIRADKLTKALKFCRKKHDMHRRMACERQARKRYGPAHRAKRSTKSSRGGKK